MPPAVVEQAVRRKDMGQFIAFVARTGLGHDPLAVQSQHLRGHEEVLAFGGEKVVVGRGHGQAVASYGQLGILLQGAD